MQDSSSVMNPWASMWLRPRETVRHLVQTNPDHRVLLLAGLAGVVQALDRAAGEALGDALSLPMILGFTVVMGPVFGIISLYLGSVVVAWTGKWIGGSASRRYVRTAMAWAGLPVVAALVLWVVMIAAVGDGMFITDTSQLDTSLGAALLVAGSGLALIVLGIWSLVLFVKALGEVQGFSAWKGLGNVTLAIMAIAVPLAAIVMATVLLAR